jgi:type IV secretion system protein VirD4
MSLERPVYVLGAARSGKTSQLMIPFIMEAPGPVVATSSRKDILDATFAFRRDGFTMPLPDGSGAMLEHGPSPVWVFDPTGIIAGEPEYERHRIHWNPLRGCTDQRRAHSVAAALVGSEDLSAENATWSHIGVGIVQSLILAGALAGVGLDTVFEWSQNMGGMHRAMQILEASDDPKVRLWAEPLRTLKEDDARTRSNKMLTVTTAFEPLSLPSVRSWFRPSPSEEFDMRGFLRSQGTVYVLSPLRNTGGQAESSTAVFVNLFLNELRDTARDLAAHAPYGKLEPYALMVLDEVANISPWEGLPQMDTAGSGDGIVTVKAFQSRDQARQAWTDGEEKQMWDNSQKLITGGQATVSNLQEISTISGERERVYHESSYRGWPLPQDGLFGGSVMERHETKPVLSADDVRRIPSRRALLVVGSDQAASVALVPWWERGYKVRSNGPWD